MKSYRGGLPKPDNLGRWRPVVGKNEAGKAQRFFVGNVRDTTPTQALSRLNVIRDLFDRQCREYRCDTWARSMLPWANRAAKEIPVRWYGSDYSRENGWEAAEYLGIIHRLQSWGFPIQIMDPTVVQSGQDYIREFIQSQVKDAISKVMGDVGTVWGEKTVQQAQQTLPADWMTADQRGLHDALDAYAQHIRGNNKLTSYVRRILQEVSYLKEHHPEDITLWKLDLPEIQQIAAYWRNRPETKKGGQCSFDHAHGMLKTFFRFLHYLDEQPSFKWSLPKGTDKIPRSPIKLPSDDPNHKEAFRTIKKDTFSVEELAKLADSTDALGKAIIGVCVNCAFGASEIGQWPTRLYTLHQKHPKAELLGVTSTDADSWITGPRPKSGVYGEHLLWPQVARAVEPFLDGRPFLPMTSTGKPWFRPHSANSQSTFGNWWTRIIAKSGVTALPFGSLGDVLPNILRAEYGDDVASMALQHGTNKCDDLLDCYANTPFRKLFDATRELEERFRPFLERLVVTENPTRTSDPPPQDS